MVESRRAPTMMGQQSREESLFYSFRLEDQIPETHLLRLIDRYVDFTFVRDRLKSFYRCTGRNPHAKRSAPSPARRPMSARGEPTIRSNHAALCTARHRVFSHPVPLADVGDCTCTTSARPRAPTPAVCATRSVRSVGAKFFDEGTRMMSACLANLIAHIVQDRDKVLMLLALDECHRRQDNVIDTGSRN